MNAGTMKDIPTSERKKEALHLRGKFLPEDGRDIPIQGFMKGPISNGIAIKTVPPRSEGAFLEYLENTSVKGAPGDIIEALVNTHQKELIARMTSIRSQQAMSDKQASDVRDLMKQVNQEIDLSERFLEELEPFLAVLMNVEVLRFSSDPNGGLSTRARNDYVHRLKNRFVSILSWKDALPEPANGLFFQQLENAWRRIDPKHPVRGFLSTVLYEIKRHPSYIENAPWTWLGCDLNDELAEIMIKKFGDSPFSQNRLWFSKPTVRVVERQTSWVENAFFFSVCEKAFDAGDVEGNYFSGTERQRTVMYDNAGSYSYYDDSLFGVETKGPSEKAKRNLSGAGIPDEYLGPLAYSYGNRSFRLWKLREGFRYGDFDSCFMDSEWLPYKPSIRQNATLFGSTLSSGAKKNFVHPGAQIAPKQLTDGAFDYSEIMDGFWGTIVLGSLKECTFVPGWGSGNIGENLLIPENFPQHNPNSPPKANWDALKGSIAIGENTLSGAQIRAGGNHTLFLSSANKASFSGDSAIGSVFYKAACGAIFLDRAGTQARISTHSLRLASTKIGGHAFQFADISWLIADEATISEYPFQNAKRVSLREHAEIIQSLLEKKIQLLTKSVTSWAVARNNTIENAIRQLSFGQNEWNSSISKEESIAIKARIEWLLSPKYKEAEKEREIREALKEAVQSGNESLAKEVKKKASEMDWQDFFKSLLANPSEVSKTLERFPAETVLFDISNWTATGENNTPGISGRTATSAIEKIKREIAQMHQAMNEERKRVVIVQLCNAYNSVESEIKGLVGSSFEQATFVRIDSEFWKNFGPLVGSITAAKRIELQNASRSIPLNAPKGRG